MIQFWSATELPTGEMHHLLEALKVIVAKYRVRGFSVLPIACDNGFMALENNVDFLTIETALNFTAEDEHRLHIERFNRTIKEKIRMVSP